MSAPAPPALESPSSPSPSPRRYLVIALAAHLALVVLLRHFPYQDVVNHVARYALIDRVWRGEGLPWIRVDWVPTPYLAVDLLGAGLVHVVGPHAAVAALTILSLLLLPLGLYRLIGAVAPAERGWALTGVLLSASPFLLKGLLNYQLGVGALFFWLACWWPRRNSLTSPAALGLGAGAMLLLLIHLAAGAVALLAAGLALIWPEEGGATLGPWRPWPLRRLRHLWVIVPSLILLWLMRDTAPAAAQGDHPFLVLHGVLPKLGSLSEPFFALSPWEMVFTLGGYLAALVAFSRAHRGRWSWNLMAGLVAALAILYIITPDEVNGASHLDVRWLLPLYLMVFAVVPGSTAGPSPRVLRSLLAACVLHAGMLYAIGRGIDRKLDDYDAVLDRLPPSSRVLQLVGGEPEYWRVAPYLHFALWHTARTGGRVSSLFSYPIRPGELPRSTPIQMRHFHELDPPWSLDRPWRVMGMPPLPWARIRLEYDDIVLAGDDAELEARLAEHSCEVNHQGEVRLYAVAGACGKSLR